MPPKYPRGCRPLSGDLVPLHGPKFRVGDWIGLRHSDGSISTGWVASHQVFGGSHYYSVNWATMKGQPVPRRDDGYPHAEVMLTKIKAQPAWRPALAGYIDNPRAPLEGRLSIWIRPDGDDTVGSDHGFMAARILGMKPAQDVMVGYKAMKELMSRGWLRLHVAEGHLHIQMATVPNPAQVSTLRRYEAAGGVFGAVDLTPPGGYTKSLVSDGFQRITAGRIAAWAAQVLAPQAALGRVAAPQTPEFQRWFAGSKVVNQDGSPRVVYHGTKAPDFSEFGADTVGSQSGNVGIFGRGFYFADAKTASDYAGNRNQRNGPGGRVLPVYLALTNPFIWDESWPLETFRTFVKGLRGADMRDAEAADARSLRHSSGYESRVSTVQSVIESVGIDRFTELLKANGYDGVMMGTPGIGFGRASEYVAFFPNQIKSIFNTRPTSSPGMLDGGL